MAARKFKDKSIFNLTQEEFDNEYMAGLPVSFGNEKLNKKLDEAIEDVKNGKFTIVESGKLNEFLDSL